MLLRATLAAAVDSRPYASIGPATSMGLRTSVDATRLSFLWLLRSTMWGPTGMLG
jgi:hypothetical protein